MPSENAPSPRDWPLHSEEPGPHLGLMRVQFQNLTNPRTGRPFRATVLMTGSYVNVLPITRDREFVLVEQYRFGRSRVTLEAPAGLIHSGEDPAECALRELREETGYTGGSIVSLGAVEPNPAFMNNQCYHFLVRGCARTHDQEQDPGEDLVVRLLTEEQVVAKVRDGTINNALTLTLLSRVLDIRFPYEP
ncbi:MAG TPA: NUDIX hydrolase [Planctomycetota bacterium]|nr:NUDIX hydrolase [Planctomycetota bacterium]